MSSQIVLKQGLSMCPFIFTEILFSLFFTTGTLSRNSKRMLMSGHLDTSLNGGCNTSSGTYKCSLLPKTNVCKPAVEERPSIMLSVLSRMAQNVWCFKLTWLQPYSGKMRYMARSFSTQTRWMILAYVRRKGDCKYSSGSQTFSCQADPN